MPNELLQDAIKEAYALAPTSKVIYHTLEIVQVGVQNPIYIVQAMKPIEASDESGIVKTFSPVGFQFTLPPTSEEGFQSLNIAIDNVNQQATDFIKTAQGSETPVKMIYRPFLSDDLSKPQMIPPLTLFLKDVEITTLQVQGRATFMDIINKKFPSELYTRDRFPALGG